MKVGRAEMKAFQSRNGLIRRLRSSDVILSDSQTANPYVPGSARLVFVEVLTRR